MADPTLNAAVLKRNAMAYWLAEPGNRPVKLTSMLRDPMFWVEGYITCHKFVAGRSLAEAERVLGLPQGELQGGAYVYEFQRLPEAHEFDLRGYTQCPDGQAWSGSGPYPPGTGAAQWQVRRNTFVPARLVAIVRPGETLR